MLFSQLFWYHFPGNDSRQKAGDRLKQRAY